MEASGILWRSIGFYFYLAEPVSNHGFVHCFPYGASMIRMIPSSMLLPNAKNEWKNARRLDGRTSKEVEGTRDLGPFGLQFGLRRRLESHPMGRVAPVESYLSLKEEPGNLVVKIVAMCHVHPCSSIFYTWPAQKKTSQHGTC